MVIAAAARSIFMLRIQDDVSDNRKVKTNPCIGLRPGWQ